MRTCHLDRRALDRCAGVTLLEAVISMLLLAIMTIGLYSGILNGISLNYAAAQRTVAAGLCKERLEKMRAVDFAAVTDAKFTNENLTLTHLGGAGRIPLYGTRLSTISFLSNPWRKDVAITVAWNYRGQGFTETISGVVYLK